MSVHRDGPSTPGRSPRSWAAISAGPASTSSPANAALRSPACAEGLFTGAGQHADQRAFVGAEAVPGIDQLAMCLRPNGIHAFGSVDRDDRDWPALLVDQMLVVAHEVHASRSSRVAWKCPIALSCLPNSTKVFAPACSPRCTPSDISLSSTPPAPSRLRAPTARVSSALTGALAATAGVAME